MKFKRLTCMVLAVAMIFTVVGCGKSDKENTTTTTAESQSTSKETEVNVLGEGEKKFAFNVVDKEGNETEFEIHTDKETVGEALLDVDLIEGDEGDYGLYVKKVNGITAD